MQGEYLKRQLDELTKKSRVADMAVGAILGSFFIDAAGTILEFGDSFNDN
jgi:hypothetical protein